MCGELIKCLWKRGNYSSGFVCLSPLYLIGCSSKAPKLGTYGKHETKSRFLLVYSTKKKKHLQHVVQMIWCYYLPRWSKALLTLCACPRGLQWSVCYRSSCLSVDLCCPIVVLPELVWYLEGFWLVYFAEIALFWNYNIICLSINAAIYDVLQVSPLS